ncbi:hypothetical protein JB92DRAFT_2912638 [Gautieria morchelliformis]|nr:hypothetical protein JB92DRAFT_2912638 [Gautieria morchelliformis]
MDGGGFSGAMLDWKCPNRACGSDIPLDVYLEIFAWLRPAADPDTDRRFYNTTLARLAPVCRYFAYYATHEMWRCLEFNGKDQTSQMPAEAWCTGVHTQLQPVETLRRHVRECTLQYWICPSKREMHGFTTRIIPMLSRLDSLAILTLREVLISRALLQSIGRLKRLQELIVINTVRTGTFPEAPEKEPMFVLQETAFPALRRLELHCRVGNVLHVRDALCILAGVPSLRTMLVRDSSWLHRFLPFINPELVSLCGDLTYVPPEAFLRFIKGHAALQNLTLYFCNVIAQHSYLGIDLDPADLPDLRSFGGPFALASKVIGNRPVAKLASPGYDVLLDSEPVTFLPFTEVPLSDMSWTSWNLVYDDPEVWRGLKPIGGISHLFVRISDASEGTLSQIGLCFPNLVHLQLELPHVSWDGLLYWNVGPTLLHLKSLKTLALHTGHADKAACWISPREQHRFVHYIYQGCCPTLKQVLFGSAMMWHLRALPARAGECHCKLELISPRTIRTKLQRLDTVQRVSDWQGRIARLLREGPSGLSEVEIERIVT